MLSVNRVQGIKLGNVLDAQRQNITGVHCELIVFVFVSNIEVVLDCSRSQVSVEAPA